MLVEDHRRCKLIVLKFQTPGESTFDDMLKASSGSARDMNELGPLSGGMQGTLIKNGYLYFEKKR